MGKLRNKKKNKINKTWLSSQRMMLMWYELMCYLPLRLNYKAYCKHKWFLPIINLTWSNFIPLGTCWADFSAFFFIAATRPNHWGEQLFSDQYSKRKWIDCIILQESISRFSTDPKKEENPSVLEETSL
jgi:hypothetical protein